jgi:phenylacetate-CoA ligase
MKYALSKKNLWEKAPAPIKLGAGLLLQNIPTQYLFGKKYRSELSFLNSAQWWSKDEIEAYQLAELKRICLHAFENSPFYKRHFASSGIDPHDLNDLSDISKLPLIDRSTINDNTDELLTTSVNSHDIDYVTTGGTTGAPLRFYISSKRSQIELAYLHASWSRVGYNPNITMAVIRGHQLHPDKKGLYHAYDPLLRHHYYSSFHLNDENMKKYLDHISTIGECYLHVYPSSIAYLTRFMRRNNIRPPKNIKGIIAESEIVYPEHRKMAEELFGVRYFSSYGHTEKLVQGSECEHSEHCHIWPTYGYFELIDENGNQVVTPGQTGEIVGTGFINDVMPFIRYRTGDFATYVGDNCPKCGRNHLVIKDIEGHRVHEYLIAHDGSSIPWSAVNMHDDTFDNILRFQFVQDEPGFARLNIVPTEGLDQDNIERMKRNLAKKFDGRLNFDINLVKDIALTKSGKSIFVKQNIQEPAS